MFLIILMHSGCETEGVFKPSSSSNKAQRCIESGGVFNFNDDSCVCGETICIKKNKNDDEGYGYICDEKFECAICKEGEKRCTFEYPDCDNDKSEEYEGNCNYEYFVKTCQSGEWVREERSCEFGCDKTNLSCFECDDKEQSPMCFAKKDESICKDENDNTSSASTGKKDGNIYQCVNGYYELKETCAYGCSNAKCNTPECIEGDTECIEENDKAIVRTCKDGFWPQKCNGGWNETAGLVEIQENKICNSEKTHAVDCLSNQCVPNSDWEKLECEHQKSIVLAYINYIKQSDGLKLKSLEQINDWFEIEIDLAKITIIPYDNENPTPYDNENTIELCNSGKVKINSADNNQMISDYVSDYNDMYENEMGAIDLVKCKAFVEKYMCDSKNFNHESSEYEGLLKLKPTDYTGATIISCNSENEWDVNNITPCLKPEYEYVPPKADQEEQENKLPEYHVKFTRKACAHKPADAKYSTSCAINDAP